MLSLYRFKSVNFKFSRLLYRLITHRMAHDINLTAEEQKLRQLLLDVVEYAGNEPGMVKPQVRFAGGWVRDKLLGVNSMDIDIAVDNMTGLRFASLMKDFASEPGKATTYGEDIVSKISKIPARPEQSKHLETATLKVFGLAIDIANLRKETYSEDSRNPQMEFGTLKEDALRRDATINSLFYNLHDHKVEDLTGQGLNDMELKIIRTPLSPYQTFKDDPLRILRCIRFASRLGYAIDTAAIEAMREPNIREALRTKISRERIGIELEKMLKGTITSKITHRSLIDVEGNNPRRALYDIDRVGLYETIFTDPANPAIATASTTNWYRAYDLLAEVLSERDSTLSPPLSLIRSSLVSEGDVFLAWLLCALSPRSLPSSGDYVPAKRQPKTLAALVAREGLKVDNKNRDSIDASALHLAEIIDLKCLINQSNEEFHNPSDKRKREPISREDLGMKIHDWGSSWRNSVLLAIFVESMGVDIDGKYNPC